jgi:hypothetical protein
MSKAIGSIPSTAKKKGNLKTQSYDTMGISVLFFFFLPVDSSLEVNPKP